MKFFCLKDIILRSKYFRSETESDHNKKKAIDYYCHEYCINLLVFSAIVYVHSKCYSFQECNGEASKHTIKITFCII